MIKTTHMLAAGFFFAAATLAASAGELSYESRGYGGPLYIGPNFQEGGQHAPPVYDSKPSHSERSSVRHERVHETSKPRKAKETREAKEKTAPAEKAAAADEAAPSEKKKAESENSTISSAALHADTADAGVKSKPADAGPITCKRYIAAVGQTVTVACDSK